MGGGNLLCGDNGVVVAHFAVIDDLRRIHAKGDYATHKRQYSRYSFTE